MMPDLIANVSNEAWIAVFALLGGWLLGGLSHALRYRSDKRQRLSRAIATFLILRSTGRTQMNVSEAFKDSAAGWAEFERYRQQGLEKMKKDLEVIDPHLTSTLETIMDYAPLEVNKFHVLIETSKMLANRTLSSSAEASKKVYITLLSAVEVAFDIKRKAETDMIKTLAFKIGPAFYWKTVFYLAAEDRQVEKNMAKMAGFQKPLQEAMAEIRTT